MNLLILLPAAAVLSLVRANPVTSTDNIPIQENVDLEKLYGKWYDVAIGTTCSWMQRHKARFSMGTLVMGPGTTSEEVSMTSTRIRQGLCKNFQRDYQKTQVPGKLTYYNPDWKASIETYVASTDYVEFAILVKKKNSTHGLSTTAVLYGRSPEVRSDLVANFRQFALDLGIPEDSIFQPINKGECVPAETENGPQRVRRTTLFDQEGSADGPLNSLTGDQEADCRQPMTSGPCLGMDIRYFYNTTSKMCETFFYGGCLGSRNNFFSEKACLQTCRTEAACRLPIVPGGPCDAEFWAFDASQGKCVPFKGCGSNANKFYVEKECKEFCGILPEGDEEFLRLSTQ